MDESGVGGLVVSSHGSPTSCSGLGVDLLCPTSFPPIPSASLAGLNISLSSSPVRDDTLVDSSPIPLDIEYDPPAKGGFLWSPLLRAFLLLIWSMLWWTPWALIFSCCLRHTQALLLSENLKRGERGVCVVSKMLFVTSRWSFLGLFMSFLRISFLLPLMRHLEHVQPLVLVYDELALI